MATPLGSHGVLHTSDIDAARESIAASLAPHSLWVRRGGDGFMALHNAATLERISLHYIDYHAEVEVATERLDFCLVQIPLNGLTTVQAGASLVSVGPRSAAVTSPGEAVRMRYSAGNPRLLVQVATDLLRERIALAAESGVVVPRWSGRSFDLRSGVGRTWRSLVGLVVADLERDDGMNGSPLTARSLQLALIDGLVAALASPHAPGTDVSASEQLVRRAARLIEDHCAEPLRTLDIAEAVGVSIRTLQAGFRTHLRTTPMAHLRRARLHRVRESLVDGSATSVAEAAHRWGVSHLGRLSGDYRAEFGESPSETIQRLG
ncbi:AraC family transcriptional regulator [Xylanimonas allomyrinae]|uniref:AraC family transcriptional regulator n=1 Tax=Xylanimonas allomyrinae TaxID=2509459 RepID=UPI0013A662A8|nr:AraC family transcriptional regulator [Xylanimonas allomyrinae]